jgi:hypothetical protein
VEGVADLIVRRNPEASVTTHDVNVLSEEGTGTLMRALEDSDIVLVATGDRESAGLVNRLSLDAGVGAVYASVMAGARGGEVFRVAPHESSCYECVQRYKANDPRWKAVAEYDERTRIETPRDGCGDLFMPGTAVDTDTIALAQARLLTVHVQFRAEAAANVRGDHPDLMLRRSAHSGEYLFYEVRYLGRGVYDKRPVAPRLLHHHGRPGLDGARYEALLDVTLTDETSPLFTSASILR